MKTLYKSQTAKALFWQGASIIIFGVVFITLTFLQIARAGEVIVPAAICLAAGSIGLAVGSQKIYQAWRTRFPKRIDSEELEP